MTPSTDHHPISRTLTRRCPAKLNLTLSVGSPNDQGMHPITSWMVAISLSDDLTITHCPNHQTSTFTVDWADDALYPTPIDWDITTDLIYRAHGLLESFTGRPLPISAHLSKRIPTGMGLGGGSSDGAQMLLGLNELFDLQLSTAQLIDLSCQLGSDVAFFLPQASSMIAAGLGEQVIECPLSRSLYFVLILPPVQCPTGPIYRQFDNEPSSKSSPLSIEATAAIASLTPLDPTALFNDLTQPALTVHPKLATILSDCQSCIDRPVHLSGSGAGLFVIAKNQADAQAISTQLTAQADAPTLIVTV